MKLSSGFHILRSILVGVLIVPPVYAADETAPGQPGVRRPASPSASDIRGNNLIAQGQQKAFEDGEIAKDKKFQDDLKNFNRQVRDLNRKAEAEFERAKKLMDDTRKTYNSRIAALASGGKLQQVVGASSSAYKAEDFGPTKPVFMNSFSDTGPYRSAVAIAALKPRRVVSAFLGENQENNRGLVPKGEIKTDTADGFIQMTQAQQGIAQVFTGAARFDGRPAGYPKEAGDDAEKNQLVLKLTEAVSPYGIGRGGVISVVSSSTFTEDTGFQERLRKAETDLFRDAGSTQNPTTQALRRTTYADLLGVRGGTDHKFTDANDRVSLTEAKSTELLGAVTAALIDEELKFQGDIVREIAAQAETGAKAAEEARKAAEKLQREAEEFAKENAPQREAAGTPPDPNGGGPSDSGGDQAGQGGGGQGGGGQGGGDSGGGGGSGGAGGGIPFGGGPPGFRGSAPGAEAVASTTAANKQNYQGLSRQEIAVQDPATIPPFQTGARTQPVSATRQLASAGPLPDFSNRSQPGGVPTSGGREFDSGSAGPAQTYPGGPPSGGSFEGNPFNFGSNYGARGKPLKDPVIVGYGSGSANSTSGSPGSINTGAGNNAAQQIVQAQTGVGGGEARAFGVFGQGVLAQTCSNSEPRAKIGSLCREARKYTVTMDEELASAEPSGKARKTSPIAVRDVTL